MDILLIATLTFFSGLLYILYTHGLTHKVRFEQKEMARMPIAYRLAIGDYANSAKTMEQVYQELTEQGIDALTGFGIYFDNPAETPKERLRSLMGCILNNETDFEKISGLKHARLPASSHLVATFPYKGKFSVALGAMKVYTALARHRNEHHTPVSPVMEIYDAKNGNIIYIVLTGIEKEFLEDLVKVE